MDIFLINKATKELIHTFDLEDQETDTMFHRFMSWSMFRPESFISRLKALEILIDDVAEDDNNPTEVIFSVSDLLVFTSMISQVLATRTWEMQQDLASEFYARLEERGQRKQSPAYQRIKNTSNCNIRQIAPLSQLLGILTPLVIKNQAVIFTDKFSPEITIPEELTPEERDEMLLHSTSLLTILEVMCTEYTDGAEQLNKLERFFQERSVKQCISWYKNQVRNKLKK